MKYYKSKEVITKYTVLRLVYNPEEEIILYDKINDIEYYGVKNVQDGFLDKQHAECEVTEMKFEEIKTILDNCRLMQQFNDAIEREIAVKYSIAKEIGITNSDHNGEEYTAYREYVNACKERVNKLKIEWGLKEGGTQ